MDAVHPTQNLDLSPKSPSVIYGHKSCQTMKAKWLCLDKIYFKFQRPNFYDIGGTYMQDLPDFWFAFKIEIVGEIYLLHLFVIRKYDRVANIAVSCSNEITLDRRNPQAAYLTKCLKEFEFQKEETPDGNTESFDYVTTYSFTDLDIEFLKERRLYILVEFPISEGLSFSIVNDVKFRHDCGSLLADPYESDFCIESTDGKKFNIHKLIISAHSEVFTAMLKDDTAESQNNYVKLVDVNSDDLRCMLEFIYTGTVKDLDNVDFVNVLMLADRFNLKGLSELAQYALAKQITVENALDIFIIADMYDSEALKNATLKFIKKNNKSLKTITFKRIENTELVKQLCIYLTS